MAKKPRTKEQVLAAINKVVKLIEGGMQVEKAKRKIGVSNSSWAAHRPLTIGGKPVMKRRTSAEVDKLVMKAHALVSSGTMTVEGAAKKFGLGRSLYDKVRKRLNLAPRGAMSGSMNADMLPPRPEKKKRMGYVPITEMPDMNNVQALAGRIGLLDKKLAGVDGLRKQRKIVAKRLMQLLRGGR